jgi:uncharacterized membrane protein YhaH (DUF805 family)
VLLAALAGIALEIIGLPVLLYVYGVVVLAAGIVATVRRLHDVDRSGWWLFIALVPIVGAVMLIAFLATEGRDDVVRRS